MAKGDKPDYFVSAINKDTGHKGRVGAAWKKPDGSIGIKLNPFVVLTAGENFVITLFVNDDDKKFKKFPVPKKAMEAEDTVAEFERGDELEPPF